MRSKNILSIAAFIAAFAFSTAFAGLFIDKTNVNYGYGYLRTNCGTSAQISKFLYRDISNGRERDRRVHRLGADSYETAFSEEFISEYTEIVDNYAKASAGMNDEHLPLDLRIAWRKHMTAWHDYSDFLKHVEENTSSLRSSAHIQSRDAYLSEIDTTWYEVLRIAGTHGARVSSY